MTPITNEILKRAAKTLMFEMTDEQFAVLEEEFSTLLAQMDLIGNILDIDSVEPMTFPFDVTTSTMREDIPLTPSPVEEILKNAGHVEDHQIKLPKVVG